MKKRAFSAGAAALLVLSCAGMAASSADAASESTITENGGTAVHEVYATYEAVKEAKVIYSVEIKWGSMEFTYTAPTLTKTWNPTTHTYTEETAAKGEWTNEEDANMVTVTSKSNAALKATITPETKDVGGKTYTNIKATAANPTLNLADASDGASTTQAGTISTANTTISLNGELKDTEANKAVIGSVTVTIEDADAQQEVQP